MPPIVNVGNFCVTYLDGKIAVTDVQEPLYEDESKWLFPPQKISGFEKFVAWKRGIAVCSTKIEDMDVIYFIRKGTKYGESYALNLTVPYFSEYGDSGHYRD